MVLALALHGGGLGWVLSLDEPERPAPVPKKVDEYAKLKAMREKIELPKPEPPPPPPEKKEEPPPPEPKKEEPKEVVKPKKKKKPQKKRMARAKPKREVPPPPPAAPPPPPAPLALENVNLTGGVNVQRGETDTFGDPSIAANKANTEPRPPPPDLPVGDEDVEPEPEQPPKRVGARIKRNVKGTYPADAPKLGRDVVVKLSLALDEEGRVAKVRIIIGAGEIFDREARKLARRLRFYPATLDGVPIPSKVPYEVVFQPE